MQAHHAVPASILLGLALALPGVPPGSATVAAQQPSTAHPPSPQQHFGYPMGADGRLADWAELAAYYRLLADASPRVEVVDMGPSTLGKPFLALFVSSPGNLARLEELRRLNAVLADPRGVPENEIERAIEEGRAVVVQSYGLHSTEVAGAQTPAELVWEMATRDDPEMARILDEVVAIMLPSLNPDGTTMVAEWVRETAGTEYEGARLPWLYHHYIGHDNNRDAFQQNTAESIWGGQILFRDWVPQAFVDHHQMGAWGPRLYVPPYAEPIRPDADPLVWREMSWWGAHIAYAEEAAGRSGVTGASIYSGWGHFGFHWITPFHNTAGMLTESASARMAWPLFVHPDQLEGRPGRGLPAYEEQTTFPNPWPGGWWTVRDIVEQQKIASLATLDLAAKNRRMVLRNHYLKALRQTERGRRAEPVSRGPRGPLAAFIVPADQHDPYPATEMVEKLLLQGIDIERATEPFTHEGRVYDAGSWIVSMAQPKRGLIRWLLGRTFYPDNTFTRYRDGAPIPPYDMSTDNIAEYMGVRVEPVATHVEAPTTRVVPRFAVTVRDRIPWVTSGIEPVGEATAGRFGYLLDGRWNDAFRAANLLLDRGVAIRRVDRAIPGTVLRPGDFVVASDRPADRAAVEAVAAETGLAFTGLDADPAIVSRPVTRLRVGMVQRYYGGNMDEGWTRLLLERFGFPYASLRDDRIRAGRLDRDFDVIILPSDDPATMRGPGDERSGGASRSVEGVPPQYRSGFGQEGVDALEAFVENGGTLV
ncbi:MAG TPA: M14 family zinc carboxypeptidase, partial [Longimicrobiales bacterium]|nr:M14 family zinc carboxypeptidase [Longimicrobiales bacterium]